MALGINPRRSSAPFDGDPHPERDEDHAGGPLEPCLDVWRSEQSARAVHETGVCRKPMNPTITWMAAKVSVCGTTLASGLTPPACS
jgi:hypothetical protein